MTAIVKDPDNEGWLKLEPGEMIVINNRRVMHGRSEISGSSGRVLCGCYINYEDFLSKIRVLNEHLRTRNRLAPS